MGFTIPNNPTREQITTNIGAGSALVLIPWDWKLCKGRGESWPIIQNNVTVAVALETKAVLGLAIPNKEMGEYLTTDIGEGVVLNLNAWDWKFYVVGGVPIAGGPN